MTATTNPSGAEIQPFTICSWNLRYDSQPNSVTVAQSIANLPDPLKAPARYLTNTNERPWSERRIPVANTLSQSSSDIIGFQEALKRQIDDISELLGEKEWDWVGVGRDNGSEAGEYCPIFFRRSRFQLVEWDTFWLSNEPFSPSKYPGAGSYRLCTVAHLRDLTTSQTLKVLNTHLDDRSDAQRRLGASLLLHRARFEGHVNHSRVILLGDFNSSQDGRDGGAYGIVAGGVAPVSIDNQFEKKFPVSQDEEFRLLDIKAETPRQFTSGHYATFTGFVSPTNTSNFTRIDFIFGGSNKGWIARSYRVENSLTDDGLWMSDHRPVFCSLELID
ncbi:mannose-6-phosphatase [Clavulina sp. PMI_390]|nr:mannose-6-phosphatase [Clavulina sp. PMI_390]